MGLRGKTKIEAWEEYTRREEKKELSWRENAQKVYSGLDRWGNVVVAREPAMYEYPTFRLIEPPLKKHVPVKIRKKFNQFDPQTIKKSTDFFSHMSDIAIRKAKYRIPQSKSIYALRAGAPRFDESDEFPMQKERERFVTVDHGTLP